MEGGDPGLQRVRAEGAAELLGALELGQAAADEQAVPARTVLVEQQHGLARGTDAGGRARGLDLHEGHQAVHLGLLGQQPGQDATQPQRLGAQLRTQPVVPRRGRVALVEHQIDHLEHRGQPLLQLGAGRSLEGHLRLGERPLGPDDALRHRRLRDQERPGDLLGGQAAEQAQRERHPRLGGQHRMAGGEHQAQEVVAHLVVEGGVQIGLVGVLADLELPRQLLLLALLQLAAAQPVDRAVLGRAHQPGARVVRDALLGPLLQGRHERLLGEVLGQAQVANDAGQAGDQPGRLDPPDRLDRPMGVGDRHRLPLSAPRPRPPAYCSAGFTPLMSTAWTSSEKSDISATRRTSTMSPSAAGMRDAHSTASSLDLTSMSQ